MRGFKYELYQGCFFFSFLNLQLRALCSKGDRAFKNEQYLQAISFYSDALMLSPYNEDVLGCRSVVYAKLGMFNESKKDAESLISIIPQKPKVKNCTITYI